LGKRQGLLLLKYEALAFPQKWDTQSSVDFLPQPSTGPSLTWAPAALQGSQSAAPLNSHRTSDAPALSALRGSSEHTLPGEKVGRPCLWLRLSFTEVLWCPLGQESGGARQRLSLGSLGWWQSSPAPWPGLLLFETEEKRALWCEEKAARPRS